MNKVIKNPLVSLCLVVILLLPTNYKVAISIFCLYFLIGIPILWKKELEFKIKLDIRVMLLDLLLSIEFYFKWFRNNVVVMISDKINVPIFCIACAITLLVYIIGYLFVSYFFYVIDNYTKKRKIISTCFMFILFILNIMPVYYNILSAVSVYDNGYTEKNQIHLEGEKNTSYFDATIVEEGEKVFLRLSDRSEKSIVEFEKIDDENFENKKVLYSSNKKSWWQADVNRACFIDEFMYFTGQSEGKSYIGVAKLDETGQYNLVEDTPIMIPDRDYEIDSVMNPYVIKIQNEYYMYYAAGETYEPDVICLAISKDGINYDKKGVVLKKRNLFFLDSKKVGACEVYKQGEIYIMYYIGYTDVDTARICYATSEDGISWNRRYFNCLVSPSKEFDYCAVYKPTVFCDGEKESIYYNGRSGSHETIGVAMRSNKND